MGRFLCALLLLLVFVAATGFCQTGSFDPGQRAEIKDIVRDVVRDVLRDEFQSLYRQQPVPVPVSPAININIPPNISQNERIIPPAQYLIRGCGQFRQEDIVAFIASKNRGVSHRYIVDLVKTYFCEAEFEYINHDIAIAQMLYATDYLGNIQRTAAHNYSGMLNVSFCDMTTGVRAHIQHLRFYTMGSLADPRRNVDPRYSVLKANRYLGTVTTLDDLCGKWSESPWYLTSIKNVLAEMTHFAMYRR